MVNAVTLNTIGFNKTGMVNPVYTYSGILKDKDFKIHAIGEIVPDSCDPTTPAIAANTSYDGPVTFRFSDTVSAVSFDAGCFNAARSTAIIVYGKNDFKIERVVNQNDDSTYAHFSFDFGENVIKKVVIKPIGSEPAGFAVDNLSVSIRPEHQKVANVGNVNIDNLIWGTKWAENTLTYSFLTATSKQPGYGTGPETFPTSKMRAETSMPFSVGQKAMTHAALDMWDDVANLTFQKVSDNGPAPGMLRFGRADISAPADAFLPDHDANAGDVRINTNRPTAQAVPGSYDFYVFIHEFGHALGLKHPHEPGGNGTLLPAAKDSHEFSIMSYRSYPGQSVANVTNAADSYPQTLMMNDIAAMQYLYGANFSTHAGNTTYSFDPAKAKIFETIWDGGGNDTYDASAYHVGVSIDLHPGKWSVLKHSQLAVLDPDPMNTHLARASVFNARLYNSDQRSLIENAIGGDKADKLVGNITHNSLVGGDGNDTLDGMGGNDTLNGELGADKLFGGSGVDTLMGGQDRDLLLGNAGADRLLGGKGFDVLHGGNDNDVLIGGAGRDTMSGGFGDDIFVFNSIADSSGTSLGRDHIVDFTHGDDHIVVSMIDADATTPGNQAFSFIGTAQFSGKAGELRYISLSSATIAKADVNGDKVPDFSFEIDRHIDLVGNDFVL